MPDLVPDTPASPPAGPVVARGLATTTGYAGTGALWVAALVDAIVGGNIDTDTRRMLITGAAVLIVTNLGRMLQAAAARIGEGQHRPAGPPAGPAGDLDQIAAEEHDAAQAIPDDPGQLPPDVGDTEAVEGK